jgi:hypothetical protein
LEHVQDLLQTTAAQRGASYAAAQFLLVDKLLRIERIFRSHDRLYEQYPASVVELLDIEFWQDTEITPSYLLGHSVEDPGCGIHGDEEYLYEIELPSRDILEESTEWRVKISEHCGFPRRNKKIQRAFELADWQFNGPLSEALSEVNQR